LVKQWKITIQAALAGKMEMVLDDPITRRPIYGRRRELTEALYRNWLDREAGKPEAERSHVPSLLELRSQT